MWSISRADIRLKRCQNPKDSSWQMPLLNDYRRLFVSPQSLTWRAKKILRPNKNLFNLFDKVCNKIFILSNLKSNILIFLKEFKDLEENTFIKVTVFNLSLLYTVKGRLDSLKPYLIAAHYDVVPAGENWTIDPFSGFKKTFFIIKLV